MPEEAEEMKLPETMRITVCSECLQASCWHSQFYCDKYKTAGTVDKTVKELRAMNLEHESYWEHDYNAKEWRLNQEKSK